MNFRLQIAYGRTISSITCYHDTCPQHNFGISAELHYGRLRHRMEENQQLSYAFSTYHQFLRRYSTYV
jgi:hypothetical protein